MTYTALVNTLGSYERQNGTASYAVTGKVHLKKYNEVSFDNLFAGDNLPFERLRLTWSRPFQRSSTTTTRRGHRQPGSDG